MVNYYDVYVIFQDTEYPLQENIFHHFLQYSFLQKSLLNWKISLIYSKLFTGSFHNIAQPYKPFTSQYWRNDDYLLIS